MGILKMKKVEIMGERERLDKVLAKLQDFSVLHIEDAPLENSKANVRPAISEEEKEILKKVERGIGLIEEIKKDVPYLKAKRKEELEGKNLNEILVKLDNIWKEFVKIKEEERKTKEELSLYSSFNKILEAFEELFEKREIEIPEDFEVQGALLPREELIVVTRIENALKKEYKDKVKIFYRIIKGNQLAILIAFSPDISGKIKERLWKEGLPEIKLPQEMEKLPFKETMKFLRKKLEEIPPKIKEIEERKIEFLKSEIDFLFTVYFLLYDLKDFLKIKEKGVFVTKHFFYLEGFVPENELNTLKSLFKNEKGIYIRELKPEKEEYKRIPVVLKNPSYFKNFEPLIEFFSLPVYLSFDPTPVLSIFFPIYFGFMLGDIGYGFLGAVLFLFLYTKFKNNTFIRKISFVFLMASIFSIIFGILYMEMFGDLLERLGVHPIFNRVHDANTYLLYALIFGTIQIILGLLLGIYNAIKLGHKKHAIGVLSMLLGLICVLLLAGASLGVFPSSLSKIFLILLFVFMILSFIFHGPAAPIEIFSAFGHILSFARLMAIGLSSAIIAVIANKFLSILPSLVIGIIVMLLFHVLAFVLGLFDPTVQGLRLQFVEFFTKFYEAGGREYKPFFKRLKGVQLPELK